MSRHLPENPNLDHLKKQAKDLLGDLETRNPGAKLADALHAIAREYGFRTWPELKAHVESLPRQMDHAAQENPFVGHWTADLSKSKRHPANEFQSATLEFAVAGDAVTITNNGVNGSGQEEHGTYTIQADGREYPPGGTGHVSIARWIGTHVLEIEDKKDGRVVGRGTYEISADGATLTISAPEQVLVLDRRKS